MPSIFIPGSVPLELWALALAALAITRLLSYRYKKGLSKYNGPFLASFTDLWRCCYAYTHMSRPPMLDLHEKYGDIVRVGPNTLSFGYPEAIKDIYGAGKAWDKSGFYPVQAAVVRGRAAKTLFSSPDIAWHNSLRKAINPYFTATAAVGYEPLVDKTIKVFLKQWDSRFAGKEGPDGVIDLADWLLYFSFDVIGELTYGSRHGFMESGSDHQGIISFLQHFAVYGSVMGPSPFWDKFLRHNPILLWLERQGLHQGSTFSLGPFVGKRIRDRITQDQKRRPDDEPKGTEDLLDKFLKAREIHPKAVSDQEVLSLSLTMVLAGAETISITLTALFYYLLKNPRTYELLEQEIDTHFPSTSPLNSDNNIPYAAASKLPYLSACLQETFRLHPASAVLLERIVPASGATIGGEQIAGGTVVGVSSWAVHHDRRIFGEDCYDWRPERWLEGGEEKRRAMERAMLHFGAGNHLCLGKNVSAREMWCVVPSLMRTFRMELMNPEKDWTIITTLSTRQEDVMVRVKRRT